MLDSSTLSKDGRDSYRISQTLTDDLYPSYKILVIGDANTGKTSLIRRYVSNEFLEDNESTIGLDFQSKKVQIAPNDKIILKIWDTAGSEKFNSIAQNYFTNSDGIILCFDNANKTSFDNLDGWINYINKYVEILENSDIKEETKEKDEEEEEEEEEEGKKVVIKWFDNNKNSNELNRPVIILAGTKSDLEQKEVKMEDIEKLKQYLNCEYFETSSKNGNGVDDLFFFMAKELFNKIGLNQKRKDSGFKLENKRIIDDEKACNSKFACC